VYDPLEWFLDSIGYTLEPWQRKVIRAIIEREARESTNKILRASGPWHLTMPRRPPDYDSRMALINVFAEQRLAARNKRPVRLTDITLT
jgi:hypothetical protein